MRGAPNRNQKAAEERSLAASRLLEQSTAMPLALPSRKLKGKPSGQALSAGAQCKRSVQAHSPCKLSVPALSASVQSKRSVQALSANIFLCYVLAVSFRVTFHLKSTGRGAPTAEARFESEGAPTGEIVGAARNERVREEPSRADVRTDGAAGLLYIAA